MNRIGVYLITLIFVFSFISSIPAITHAERTYSIYVPIQIFNNEGYPSVPNFDEKIIIDFSQYKTYLNEQLSNIRFYNSSEFIQKYELHAWIENNDSYNSHNTTVWINMANTIIPANSYVNIYMNFLSKTTGFDSYLGIAPQLSTNYAQYDNGYTVFYKYWNFSIENRLPEFFNTTGSSGYTLNNGITISSGASIYSKNITDYEAHDVRLDFCGNYQQASNDNSAYFGYFTPISPQSAYLYFYLSQKYTVDNQAIGGYYEVYNFSYIGAVQDGGDAQASDYALNSAKYLNYTLTQGIFSFNAQKEFIINYKNYGGITSNWDYSLDSSSHIKISSSSSSDISLHFYYIRYVIYPPNFSQQNGYIYYPQAKFTSQILYQNNNQIPLPATAYNYMGYLLLVILLLGLGSAVVVAKYTHSTLASISTFSGILITGFFLSIIPAWIIILLFFIATGLIIFKIFLYKGGDIT